MTMMTCSSVCSVKAGDRMADDVIIGSTDKRDAAFNEIINGIDMKRNLIFGIDLRNGAITESLNGSHETAVTIESADKLIIRLMGSMMARFAALEAAHSDDIHKIEPDIMDVIVLIDDMSRFAGDDNFQRGINCIKKIGGQAGYHVHIGCDDACEDDFNEFMKTGKYPVHADDTMVSL